VRVILWVVAGTSVMAANAPITGTIEFPEATKLPPQAKVYVRLLDTSAADAPARLVAEQVLQELPAEAHERKKIRFELRSGLVDERADYTVSVLVDVDGDGRLGRGDFINMQSYPVLTRGYPSNIEIVVEQVR
jgi:uncharacterized lipoprotein YbaY